MRLLLVGLLCVLALTPVALSGEANVAGNWKLSMVQENQTATYWILSVQNQDGKLKGKVHPLKGILPTTLESIEVKGDMLHFNIRLDNGVQFAFEGKVPAAGGKKIYGSMSPGPQVIPAVLEATSARNQFELDKELVERNPYDPKVFTAILEVVKNGKAEKAAPEDIQGLVETVLQASEKYGPRWQSKISLRLLDALSAEYPDLAVNVGRKMEASLDPKAPAATQLQLLDVLLSALKKAGQAGPAKQMEGRIDKLENGAYAEHAKTALAFPVEKFAGRKGKSTRAVVMELFTGAQCPPCVAADLAFDAVEKSYRRSDVVLLQYHLHVPGPDPLTNPDAEARQEYYGSVVRGTPALLVNGKKAAAGGGFQEHARDKYKEYQKVIEPLLETESTIKLTASAVRAGNKIAIQAAAQGVSDPGEKVRLRLALVEDWVRYKASNGMNYHHRVVRALPGGAKGTPLTKKDGEVSVTVNVDELQGKLRTYLDNFSKEEPFPDGQRPLRLRNLHVVAMVQNDDTAEILQAVDVAVTEE